MQIPKRYVLFRPLADVDADKERPQTVIFFADPDELSALVILANYGRGSNENVIIPFAAGCRAIGNSRRSNMTRKLEHGAVWLADLNPQRGMEPGKTRPVLIIQNQALLDAGHPSTLVIPLTTRLIEDAAPLRLRLSARDRLDRDSDLLIDQIRAIDNQRLVTGPLTLLGAEEMSRIYPAILEVMGIELNPQFSFQKRLS